MKKLPLMGLMLWGLVAHAGAPDTILMDGTRLAWSRQRIQAGDEALRPAFTNLMAAAEEALASGPFSVVNKSLAPASGDKHDYLSFSRYWWPDPDKPDGLPYIRRDGETNPGSQGEASDRPRIDKMTRGVETLGLAYYFTGERNYAERAALLFKTWFLDPETRMNPNLNHGQAVPGRESGRKSGLIDARLLCRAIDGVILIREAGVLTDDEQRALRGWFVAYLDWLKTSELARAEAESTNNHGTFFDVQIVHIALFVGDRDYARSVVEAAVEKRILAQIQPDGTQPEELARTRGLFYSIFNLEAMFCLARLAEHVEVDLWRAGGSRIRAGLDYVAPYADPSVAWPHPTIKEVERDRLLPLLLHAAAVFEDIRYLQLAGKLPAEETVRRLEHLVFPLMR